MSRCSVTMAFLVLQWTGAFLRVASCRTIDATSMHAASDSELF